MNQVDVSRSLISYKDKLTQTHNLCAKDVHRNFLVKHLEEDSDSDMEFEDISTIRLSSIDKLRSRTPWINSIIIKPCGKALNYNYIDYKIRKMWKSSRDLRLIDLGRIFFIAKFGIEEDFVRTISGVPWFLNGQYLTMRLWQPKFNPLKDSSTTTAIWARLPQLPVDFYDRSILEKVGEKLGTLFKVDARTTNAKRGRFARLCRCSNVNQS